MSLLAFDCCLRSLSVAVLTGDRITTRATRCESGHAELLMPMIADVMAQASVRFADLQRIAVTLGPGGFTSVRVGVAAARGFALALGVPAVGQSSLQALAHAAGDSAIPEGAARLISVIPAGKGGFYWQPFSVAGAVLSPAMLIESDSMPAQKIDHGDVLIGPGAVDVLALLPMQDHPVRTMPDLLPRADILAKIAKHLTPQSELRPIYLRAADARPQTGQALLRA
jgi:tRNA threonylcarbamoyladenosine biosynthesis protein TsaB